MVSPPWTATNRSGHGGFSVLSSNSSFQAANAPLWKNMKSKKTTTYTTTTVQNPPSFHRTPSRAPYLGIAGEKLISVSKQTPNPPPQFSFLNWLFPQLSLLGKCKVAFFGLHSSAAQSEMVQVLTLFCPCLWTVYCNGRKVGFAIKRRPSKADMDVLRLMGSVVVGAGIISGKELNHDDELMYLRANFERVCGSSDTEAFHLIDPDGSNIGQELSIFFHRSR